MWPDPGGFVSVLLLVPIIVFGSRMAGASPIEKTRGRRIRAAIVLAICVLLIAGIPVILFYGIFCGIQIVRQGEGGKRFLIGSIVMACVLFATADFVAALGSHGNYLVANEAAAVGTLRRLSSAEEKFFELTLSAPAKDSRYGTMEDLRKNHLIDEGLQAGKPYKGYVFRESLDPARKQFLFYGVPARLPRVATEPGWVRFVPGQALYYNAWKRDETYGTGDRSFAVDETGTIRFATSPITGSLQREEIERWGKL
jgi:hypothetical protein